MLVDVEKKYLFEIRMENYFLNSGMEEKTSIG